jgi:hypothetical protein
MLFVLVGCACLPEAAGADWHEPVAGPSPINSSATRSADAANLAVIDGTPYVAWNEDTTQQGQGSSSTIHVAQLAADGQSWVKVGENGSPNPISLLPTTSSDSPWLADVGGTPWVAWQEGVTQQDSEIRVAKFSNGSWSEIPAGSTNPVNHPINHDRAAIDGGGQASTPTLIDDGTGHPFVSFYELDPGSGSFINNSENPSQVWVDQLNQAGNGWNEVGGGSVNADPSSDAIFPSMTVINGVPWVAYWQLATVGNGPGIDVNVAHLSADGQSWVQEGPVVSSAFGNNGPTVGAPSIANIGGTPYVTFTNNSGGNAQVFVYSFDGTNWNQVGGGPASDPSVDAQSPSIADIDGSPWVSWSIDSPTHVIQTAQLTGGAWKQAGTTANDDPNHSANNGSANSPVGHSLPPVSLTSVNGFPWIGFVEADGTQPGGQNVSSCCNQVRVSRLEPTFLAHSAEPSDTSATLLTKLQTYGLPYPVAFEWGPGGSLTHTTPFHAASGDPAFSFTSIGGLHPSTLYSYMPVATAGTPQPLVDGPSDAFVTQAAQSSGQLYAFILRAPRKVKRGQQVNVRYYVSDGSTVDFTIKHAGQVVARFQRHVQHGVHGFVWSGVPRNSSLPDGVYTVVLVAHSHGRQASDWAPVDVVG